MHGEVELQHAFAMLEGYAFPLSLPMNSLMPFLPIKSVFIFQSQSCHAPSADS